MEDDKFNLFTLFLKSLIEGDKKYESFVKPVIRDAHDLVLHEKDVQDIDKDSFPIIIYLEKRAPKFLKGIQPDNITIQEYEKILSLLEQHSSTSFI